MFAYEYENPVLPFHTDRTEDEGIDQFLSQGLLRYGERSPPLHPVRRRTFEALPFVPLPRSTAAEFSWQRNYDEDAIFDDDDSESLRSSESSNSLEMNEFQPRSNSSSVNFPPARTRNNAEMFSSYSPLYDPEPTPIKKETYPTQTEQQSFSDFPFAPIPPPKVKKQVFDQPPIVKRDIDAFEDVPLREPNAIPIIPSGKVKAHRLKGLSKLKKRKLPLQNVDNYKKVMTKHTPGKKPKLKQRWTLMCTHCNRIFNARPTPKNSRYVVNHICPSHGNKRKQFVIGTRARRCENAHEGPCIQQLLKIPTKLEERNETQALNV